MSSWTDYIRRSRAVRKTDVQNIGVILSSYPRLLKAHQKYACIGQFLHWDHSPPRLARLLVDELESDAPYAEWLRDNCRKAIGSLLGIYAGDFWIMTAQAQAF